MIFLVFLGLKNITISSSKEHENLVENLELMACSYEEGAPNVQNLLPHEITLPTAEKDI